MPLAINALSKKGWATPLAPIDPNRLHWLGFQRPVLQALGSSNVEIDANGGLIATDLEACARVMDAIFSGGLKIEQTLADLPTFTAEDNAKILADIAAVTGPISLRQFQRSVDGQSSYDLFAFNALISGWLQEINFHITPEDLLDRTMSKLQQIAGCSVLQCDYGPTFELTKADNPDELVYDGGKFSAEKVVFNRKTDKFRLNEDGLVEISHNGGAFEQASLPYVFAWLFSEAGLSGIKMTMTDYSSLTSLGGMGMSNLLVGSVLQFLHFLGNTGVDAGTLHSQGGFIEKFRFGRETGYQEWQQMGGGHIVLKNAPGIFGGMARRLDLERFHDQIEANIKLALTHRPIQNVPRFPINWTWCLQAANPHFRGAYIKQFETTRGEVAPFIAAANGGEIDFRALIEAYNEHNEFRYVACPAYRGNSEQVKWFERVRKLGGVLMPLGEGGEKAACALILAPEKLQTLDLRTLTEDDATRTEQGFLTGIIPYRSSSSTTVFGSGFEELVNTGRYGHTRPPLVIAQYEEE
jgi:hypothetical protein